MSLHRLSHPFIIGQPFRRHALRRALEWILAHRADVRLTAPGRIAGHCLGVPAGAIP